MIAFVDTEFTEMVDAQLLSIGVVTLDGIECYAELDLDTEVGRARVAASSDFVCYGGVIDMWGRVPGATCSEVEMGRRVGRWLLDVAKRSGDDGVMVAFDYSVDYELMEYVVRDSGMWERVREVVRPVNVNSITGSREGQIAAEEFYSASADGLGRHHALGDARALRAAYMAVTHG